MFNTKRDVNVELTNQEKDFKKLAAYVMKAKGYRTINSFAADCRINADYLADIISAKIKSYPTVKLLQIIADNSEGRVTLKELKVACGYSLYENNDLEQIKNIHVRRGWFCYADFGDHAIDSEIGGYRIVLIIQNNIGNKFSSNSIVIPLTSRKKKSLPTHVMVGREYGLQYDSTISCELTTHISKRRLIQRGFIQKIAECPEHLMYEVEVALMKAQGIVDLKTETEDVIEALSTLKSKIIPFVSKHTENNYQPSYNQMQQPVFA